MASADFPDQAASAVIDRTDDDRGDSLATGVAFLLGITVVQRLVGFIRSIAFCRLLEDDQLGRWSLSFSFLLMAAPLALLGIPGTFGRYYEYYRQRKQERVFLKRTTTVILFLASVMIMSVICFPDIFSRLAFGDTSQTGLMRMLGFALAAVIVFNYQVELLTAMRRVRLVSLMQLTNSVVFAAAGLTLLYFLEWKEGAVVIAFCLAACAATLITIFPLLKSCRQLPRDGSSPTVRAFWGKLLPFAAWLWISDALFNLFDAADRFMIVHFASETANAESMVGQYHSSRVIPMLLVAMAAVLSGVILPYLSHDWESGRKKLVSRRIALSIKLTGITFTVAALAILICSPLLFGWLLGGKYNDGLRVLPGTLIYCVWFGLVMVAQNYLLCAEKAKLGSLAMLAGLLLNVALNRALLPHLGLAGAVIGTAAANALALAGIFLFGTRFGLRVDLGMIVVCCLPLMLLLGIWPTLACTLVLVWAMSRSSLLLSLDEKQMLAAVVDQYRNKLRGVLGHDR